jgi:uncharacterized membrane protein
LGWRDFLAAPAASLCYGLLFVIIGLALTVGLWHTQAAYLLLPLASGFMLLGPALTIGLQAISRDLERGEHPSFARALLAWRANAGPIFHAGLALMCLFLLWLRLVQIIFALTLFHTTGMDVQSLLNGTLFTHGLLAATLAYLGRTAEARVSIDKFVSLTPGPVADQLAARPFRRPADRERYLIGLRKAGLPS